MKKHSIHTLFAMGITFGVIVLGFSKVLSFFLKLIVSRLGVTDFGDYYLVSSTFMSITTLAALGVPMSVTRFLSSTHGKHAAHSNAKIITTAYIVLSLSAVISSLALFMCARPLALYLGAPHIALYLQVLSAGIIGALYTLIIKSILLGHLNIRSSYIVDGIEAGTRFVCVLIGMWLLRPNILGAVIGYMAGTIIAAVINFRFTSGHMYLSKIQFAVSHKLLAYAWPVSASEIITMSTTMILLYLVRVHGGADSLGLYAAAVSIAGMIHLLPQMVLSVFLPAVSKQYVTKTAILPMYKKTLFWLSWCVVPPVIILVVGARAISNYIFGASYANAAHILPILAVAYGVYALFVWPNRQLLDMAGYTKHNLVLTILRTFTSMVFLVYISGEYTGISLAMAVLMGWSMEALGSIALVYSKRIVRH